MIAVLLALTLTFADSTQTYYAQQNTRALEALLAQADRRTEALLCRYRLYPLTEDETLLQDLPTELSGGTARELALLAGLWGYRTARASLFEVVTYGRRAQHFLDRARAKDPLDPYVLLIGGQSILFKPALFGGDVEQALLRFRQLRAVLENHPESGIAPLEAEVWIWYTLERLGRPEADALRQRLLAQNPPTLYRKFLQAPPG